MSTTKKAVTEVSVVEAPKQELAHPTASGLAISSSDIDIPRINIVQKLSEIDGPVGSIVIDKKHVLAESDQVLSVAVVSALKGWREDIPFDSDEMPRVVYTEAEAKELEADSEYGIKEFAEISLLIPQPDGVHDESIYPFPLGDKNYAIGRIHVAKDSYRQTYKRLATFATFNPTAPLHSRLWNFQSSLISRGKYSWHAPSLTVSDAPAPAAVSEFVSSFTA